MINPIRVVVGFEDVHKVKLRPACRNIVWEIFSWSYHPNQLKQSLGQPSHILTNWRTVKSYFRTDNNNREWFIDKCSKKLLFLYSAEDHSYKIACLAHPEIETNFLHPNILVGLWILSGLFRLWASFELFQGYSVWSSVRQEGSWSSISNYKGRIERTSS